MGGAAGSIETRVRGDMPPLNSETMGQTALAVSHRATGGRSLQSVSDKVSDKESRRRRKSLIRNTYDDNLIVPPPPPEATLR